MTNHTIAPQGWATEGGDHPGNPVSPPGITLENGACSPRVMPSIVTSGRRIRHGSIPCRGIGHTCARIPTPHPHYLPGGPPTTSLPPWTGAGRVVAHHFSKLIGLSPMGSHSLGFDSPAVHRDRQSSNPDRRRSPWLVGHIRRRSWRLRFESGRSHRIDLTREKHRLRTHGDARPRVNKVERPVQRAVPAGPGESPAPGQ